VCVCVCVVHVSVCKERERERVCVCVWLSVIVRGVLCDFFALVLFIFCEFVCILFACL